MDLSDISEKISGKIPTFSSHSILTDYIIITLLLIISIFALYLYIHYKHYISRKECLLKDNVWNLNLCKKNYNLLTTDNCSKQWDIQNCQNTYQLIGLDDCNNQCLDQCNKYWSNSISKNKPQ
jgi:hypothetical protein